MAHQITGKIRYSETGSDGVLTTDGLVNYFQDCSFDQSETIGYGIEYLKENHVAWLLSYWDIHINRLPRLKEEVVVKTWPYGFKGFFGYRNFVMETSEGEMLACANSLWVYIDTTTGKPAKAPQEEMEAYGNGEPLDLPKINRKIRLPEQMEKVDEREVLPFFIDTNQHMNNGKYILLAQQYLKQNEKPKRISVEYRREALLGAALVIKTNRQDNTLTVSIEDKEEKSYAIVQMELEEVM